MGQNECFDRKYAVNYHAYFAAWAAVEIVTNVTGNEIPPVTGMETNNDPDDAQRTNNGAIIGLGAVAGTFGLVLQLLIPREESECRRIDARR